MSVDDITKLISSIDSSWRSISIICLTIVIIALRSPIGKFIEKATELRWKQKKQDSEMELSILGREPEAGIKQGEPKDTVENQELAVVETLDLNSSEEGEENTFHQIFVAIQSKDFERAETLFNKWKM